MVTELCRDEQIDNQTKSAMLSEWQEKIITLNSNRLMDKYGMEEYVACLEILSNAKRIVPPLIAHNHGAAR
jgi:hypothetical protein